MSSAIPNALFSIGVNAPAALARLQSPSANGPESFSNSEYLETGDHIGPSWEVITDNPQTLVRFRSFQKI